MTDGQGRIIDYLRISVTDRCNLRCIYCMPPQGIQWLPHDTILTYEETLRLAGIFAQLGVRRIRLTGGEPLVRKGLDRLVNGLKNIPLIESVMLTTNGILLKQELPALLSAGLDGVNISLDAVNPLQFRNITRRDGLDDVLGGLEAALRNPILTVKINCVPFKSNMDQWVSLAAFARENALSVRFIELMPIGQGKRMSAVTEEIVRLDLESAFGPLMPCQNDAGGGHCRYVKPEGFVGKIGFISAVSHQFCQSCNRVRLTATGFLKTCLQYDTGIDLQYMMAIGANDEDILASIKKVVERKPEGHHFGQAHGSDDELSNMNRIGG